jgi:hypothetical protein
MKQLKHQVITDYLDLMTFFNNKKLYLKNNYQNLTQFLGKEMVKHSSLLVQQLILRKEDYLDLQQSKYASKNSRLYFGI